MQIDTKLNERLTVHCSYLLMEKLQANFNFLYFSLLGVIRTMTIAEKKKPTQVYHHGHPLLFVDNNFWQIVDIKSKVVLRLTVLTHNHLKALKGSRLFCFFHVHQSVFDFEEDIPSQSHLFVHLK